MNGGSTDYRPLGTLALTNARELLDDAQLLFEHGRNARAASLAVIGLEEVGKAVLFSIAGSGAAPELVESIRKGRGNPARDHQFKQYVVEIVSVVEWQVEEYLSALADQAAGEPVAPDPLFPLVLLLDECAKHLEERQREDGASAGRMYFKTLKDSLSADDGKRFGAAYETLEELKWRGLYVPLKITSRGPDTITRADAGYQLVELRGALDQTTALEEVLEADELWAELSERLISYRQGREGIDADP